MAPCSVVSFSLAVEIGKVQIAHSTPAEINKAANQGRTLLLKVFMTRGLTSRMRDVNGTDGES